MNGYQGQIYAKDQQEQKIPANVNILQLMPQKDTIKHLKKISISAPQKTRVRITYGADQQETIQIGKTGMYEIDDIQITSLAFFEDSSADTIIDYIIARV